MSKSIKATTLLIAGLTIATTMLPSCHETFEERCRREAQEHTEKYCPQIIDQYQTLDSMTYRSNPEGFNYYYSMSELMDDASVYEETAIIEVKQNMVENLKTNISLRPYMEHNFTFTYYYRSATDGTLYTTIALTPEDYH